jgi:hypothetical protein
MTNLKEIISKAKELAIKEIEKYNTPPKLFLEFSNQKGQEIAEKLGADKDIVMLGTILMDVKLGQAFKEGKLKEHVKMSSDFSNEFLNQFEIDQETKNKIINCVEAHHATIPFTCKEAEICANADCYRFLHPKGFFKYIAILGTRNNDINEIIKGAEYKLEEKHNILSLDVCKEELEESYQMIKKLIKQIN